MKRLIIIVLIGVLAGRGYADRPDSERDAERRRWIKAVVIGGGVVLVAVVGGRSLLKHLEKKKFLKIKLWQEGIVEHPDPVLRKEVKATKFAGHEMTGTHEAREFLTDLHDEGYQFHPSEVAVFDTGFPYDESGKRLSSATEDFLNLADRYRLNIGRRGKGLLKEEEKNHGMQVASLIAGKSPIGVSSNAKISLLSELPEKGDVFFAGGLPPSGVVNFSWDEHYSIQAGMFGDSTISEISLDKLFEGKAIVVQSAGNDFPSPAYGLDFERVFMGKKISFGDRVIRVGGVDHAGVVSGFSESGKDVVVLAPGNTTTVSFDGKKETLFGGTSAAAPVVTAALADLASFLPNLSKSEAKHILRKTAVRTSTNEVSELNGAGVLNHYKLLRVAKKLADGGYPQNRQLLFSDELYDFRAEAEELFAAAELDKADPDTYMRKLRTAFFLDPDNETIRLSLADVYRQVGLDTQALFYDIPSRSLARVEVHIKLAQRADYAASESQLLEDTITDINEWVKVTGKRINTIHINYDDIVIGREIPREAITGSMFAHSGSLDDLKNLLRIAEDSDLRNTTVLPLLGRYARDNDKDTLLELLQAYTHANYPSIQL